MIILPSFLTSEFIILNPLKITSVSVRPQHRYSGGHVIPSVLIDIRLGADSITLDVVIELLEKTKEFFSELLLPSTLDIKDLNV